MMIAAVDQDDVDISVPQRACRGDAGKAAADDDSTLSLLVRGLAPGERLVRPNLDQHRAHRSPRSCSLPLMASANFFRNVLSIIQCAGRLGAVTALSAPGFSVIKNTTKHTAFMANATALKTSFISTLRISAWRHDDAPQFPACAAPE